MKKIAVVFTGGTISMKVDERLAAAIPALSGSEIMSMVTGIDKFAIVEEIQFGSFPGPHMSPERILELKQLVENLTNREDIFGVVITHGTDSLEETAYFLDLTINTPKPIVFVAAMRNNSELGHDGPSNLSAGICTASSDNSMGRGVLVVLNNEVNSAREVTKTHTLSLNTFKSLDFGPLGIIDNNKVFYYRNSVRHEHIDTSSFSDKVYLIKTCIGMGSEMMEYLISSGAEGFVIEAMGRGNVPPTMIDGIRQANEKNIPVVIVSRCPSGRVLDTYGYEGGGKHLTDLGCIFGDSNNGQKTRIKLMLILSKTRNISEIKKYFIS